MTAVSVAIAASCEEVESCCAIRREVFVVEQKVPMELEIDELDEACDHYLLKVQGIPAAAARVVYGKEAAIIGRLAVLASYRGRGLGHALMRRMLSDIAAREAFTRAELGAQAHAVSFYEKLGFTPYGELYDDAGIPHVHMCLSLGRKEAT